jgi:hypothetical protein
LFGWIAPVKYLPSDTSKTEVEYYFVGGETIEEVNKIAWEFTIFLEHLNSKGIKKNQYTSVSNYYIIFKNDDTDRYIAKELSKLKLIKFD